MKCQEIGSRGSVVVTAKIDGDPALERGRTLNVDTRTMTCYIAAAANFKASFFINMNRLPVHQFIVGIKVDGIVRGLWSQFRHEGLRRSESVTINEIWGPMRTGGLTKPAAVSMRFERLPSPENRPTCVAADQSIDEPGCVEISVWLREKCAPRYTNLGTGMKYLLNTVPTRHLKPESTGVPYPSYFIRFDNDESLNSEPCQLTTRAGWCGEQPHLMPREAPWMTFRYLYRDEGAIRYQDPTITRTCLSLIPPLKAAPVNPAHEVSYQDDDPGSEDEPSQYEEDLDDQRSPRTADDEADEADEADEEEDVETSESAEDMNNESADEMAARVPTSIPAQPITQSEHPSITNFNATNAGVPMEQLADERYTTRTDQLPTPEPPTTTSNERRRRAEASPELAVKRVRRETEQKRQAMEKAKDEYEELRRRRIQIEEAAIAKDLRIQQKLDAIKAEYEKLMNDERERLRELGVSV